MPPPDRSTLIAFAGAVTIGGANFVGVKYSNAELDPLFGAAVRFTAAAAIFFLLARLRGVPVPRGRAAMGAAIYGFLGFGVAYAFLYYALLGLAVGTASIIMAAVPLFTLMLAVAHRQERFTARKLAGGLLAVAGIGILSAGAVTGDVGAAYLIAGVLGAVAAAESSVVVKGLPRPNPLITNGIGMTAGAALLWIGSAALQESWALPERAPTWLALTYLVMIGSVALFVLFLYVIERWTASATVYALALMPVVAVALGAIMTDDRITWDMVLGGVVVMTAVYVGALRGRAPTPVAPATPPGR